MAAPCYTVSGPTGSWYGDAGSSRGGPGHGSSEAASSKSGHPDPGNRSLSSVPGCRRGGELYPAVVGYCHIVDLADAWERNAGEWIAWARAPGHDGFWESTWPALRQVLPAPGGTVVDLGCGEGRLGRLLQAVGYQVIGIDRSSTLVRAAAAASPAWPVVLADAAALPIASQSVSLIVASMSLHDIDDLTGAIREASRVLRPGGQFCIAIVHPFVTAQDDDTLHTDQFHVSRPYVQPRRYEDHIERDGLPMTFTSMHRPLSAYTDALFVNGLAITASMNAETARFHGFLSCEQRNESGRAKAQPGP